MISQVNVLFAFALNESCREGTLSAKSMRWVVYISISVPSQIFNPRHAVTLSTLHSDLRNPPPPHNLPKAKSQLLMERGRGAIEWSLGGGGGMGVYEVRYGSAQVAGEKKKIWICCCSATLKKLPPNLACHLHQRPVKKNSILRMFILACLLPPKILWIEEQKT